MAKGQFFEVIITNSATVRYQEEILSYLLLNFSLERSIEIDSKVLNVVQSLQRNPLRGVIEKFLASSTEEFRFLLFRETKYFELKIIYPIREKDMKVFVTDFFPTKMPPISV